LPNAGSYRLQIGKFAGPSVLQSALYREWFHLVPEDKSYYPDALIPVGNPYASRLPEPDNAIPAQSAQAFWVDVWIPAEARPGNYTADAVLDAGGRKVRMPIRLSVLRPRVPSADPVSIDHNSYGTSWISEQYPALRKRLGDRFYESDEFYKLLHAYHRIIYEHRGVFHQLGYGHAGKVGPEFAPRLEGTGRTRHIADWTAYDRHYGPLLDGSAFQGTERGPKPVPFVYLPVNPEWPASFLWWGEPGYEREFVNVVSEMERHFREKGWTSTRFELFFNHKKRYKGFPWDGDETRFTRDYEYFREYSRLMRLAVPANTPVKFVFRSDASWTMEQGFRDLAGIVNFWVCGGGMSSWYQEPIRQVKQRGDIVWIYGGTPAVMRPASTITGDVFGAWIRALDGYVHWLVTSPGDDPWFHFGGGAEALVYPGDRFGIEGPIPSVRLKIQRNAAEDIALLESQSGREAPDRIRAEAARLFNGAKPEDWWLARPALANTNPEEWTNADIDQATRNPKLPEKLDPDSWARVHRFAVELAGRAK
jgi:hypothetical protein